MNPSVDILMKELKFPNKDIPICIETGTHRGWGTETFAKYFKQVYTIELSKELYDFCIETYKFDNVKFQFGHSPEIIPILIKHFKQKYFLFLDAHGSGGDTIFHEQVGRMGSPALLEIASTSENPPEYIVIDDLADFDLISSYPKREQIIEAVRKVGNYEHYVIPISKGWFVFRRI